jgi:hypothetical protein
VEGLWPLVGVVLEVGGQSLASFRVFQMEEDFQQDVEAVTVKERHNYYCFVEKTKVVFLPVIVEAHNCYFAAAAVGVVVVAVHNFVAFGSGSGDAVEVGHNFVGAAVVVVSHWIAVVFVDSDSENVVVETGHDFEGVFHAEIAAEDVVQALHNFVVVGTVVVGAAAFVGVEVFVDVVVVELVFYVELEKSMAIHLKFLHKQLLPLVEESCTIPHWQHSPY